MIKLGNLVKDKISGFTGIATAKTEFFNGCIRVYVTPQELTKDGSLIREEWFDQEQLDIVNQGILENTRQLQLWGFSI